MYVSYTGTGMNKRRALTIGYWQVFKEWAPARSQKKKKKKKKRFLTFFFFLLLMLFYFWFFDVIIVLFRFNRAGVSH